MRFVFQDVSSSLGQGHPYYYTALASSTGTHNEYGLSDGADIQCEEIGPGIQYTVNTAREEINSEGHERTPIEKEELGNSMEEENPSEEISTKARTAEMEYATQYTCVDSHCTSNYVPGEPGEARAI